MIDSWLESRQRRGEKRKQKTLVEGYFLMIVRREADVGGRLGVSDLIGES